jgi:hypothetical protein
MAHGDKVSPDFHQSIPLSVLKRHRFGNPED